MYRQSEKNLLNSNISPTCPHNMANFGPLTAEIGLVVCGTPAISTGFASCLRYCSDITHQRPTKLCLMFGHLLCWYIIYAFSGDFACHRIHFTSKSCVLLYWQRYCTTLEQRASAKVRRGTRNGIMQLSLLTIFNRGRHLYFEGGHHVGHRSTF